MRQKDYIADDKGYRILKSKTVFVGINRPIQVNIKFALMCDELFNFAFLGSDQGIEKGSGNGRYFSSSGIKKQIRSS